MVSHTRSTGTFNYSYAGASQQELVRQNTTRGDYEYVYGREDAAGNPVIEQVKYDGQTGYVERDPVTGEPLLLRTPSGMQSLYVYDGIGNPMALITSANYVATAYEYDPYGVPTLTEDSGGAGTPVNPYQFKGGLHDRTTNWVKFGHRWYSVGTGRFSQQDTLDAPLDPGNANRYAFAANDPINNADPTGRFFVELSGEACLGLCGRLAFGFDGDFDFGYGLGVGGEASASVNVGVGSGKNEGSSAALSCSGSAGPVGGFGGFAIPPGEYIGSLFDDRVQWFGGWSGGVGGGCNVIRTNYL